MPERDGLGELRADDTVVRRVAVEAIGVLDEVGTIQARRDDVEPFGTEALELLQQVGVDRELQDGPAARLPRQFGIDRLVGPGAKGARRVHAAQDVGVAEPGA